MTRHLSGKTIFTILLLASGLLFLYLTLPLGRMAQMVPFRVVIPTVGLLMLQLAIELHNHSSGRQKEARQANRDLLSRTVASSTADECQTKEYLILGMIAFLPVLVYLLGFILSAMVFIWLYYRFYFRKPIILAAFLSLGFAAFLYFLLVQLLGMDSRSGVIWRLSASVF